jgi:hypothetical protein
MASQKGEWHFYFNPRPRTGGDLPVQVAGNVLFSMPMVLAIR